MPKTCSGSLRQRPARAHVLTLVLDSRSTVLAGWTLRTDLPCLSTALLTGSRARLWSKKLNTGTEEATKSTVSSSSDTNAKRMTSGISTQTPSGSVPKTATLRSERI